MLSFARLANQVDGDMPGADVGRREYADRLCHFYRLQACLSVASEVHKIVTTGFHLLGSNQTHLDVAVLVPEAVPCRFR